MDSARVVFGSRPAGVECRARIAAYAVIRDERGRVALVAAPLGGRGLYWLPGGGALPGEGLEDTALREIREELAYHARLTGRIGDAVQYFHVESDRCWYRMQATFFTACLGERADGSPEHALHWLDVERPDVRFYHECHAWAVARSRLA